MRYLILTTAIIILAPLNIFSQTISHQRISVGSGGGKSLDGTYTNFVIMGQTIYGESTDNVFVGSGGFLGGADEWFVSINEKFDLPLEFKLSQNYPNPFNPNTTISYTVPHSSHVILEVYDILGRKTATLVNEFRDAGRHTVIWQADNNSSGMYFYRIVAGDHTQARKMLLLK